MKRDMELITKILTVIEQSTKEELSVMDDFKNVCDDENMLKYTLELLKDNGYIEYYKIYDRTPEIGKIFSSNIDYNVGQLTWKGHDLLEKLRKKERKANKKAAKKEKRMLEQQEDEEIKRVFGNI